MESQIAHVPSDELPEAERAELRRRSLISFLRNPEPTWKEEDHPELASGVITWVKNIRLEGECRIPSA